MGCDSSKQPQSFKYFTNFRMQKKNSEMFSPIICCFKVVDINYDFMNSGPPQMAISRSSKAVAVGSNVTLTCQTRGNPPPVVTWSRRSKPLAR